MGIPGHSAISFPFGRTAPLAAALTLWPDIVDTSSSWFQNWMSNKFLIDLKD